MKSKKNVVDFFFSRKILFLLYKFNLNNKNNRKKKIISLESVKHYRLKIIIEIKSISKLHYISILKL